MSEQEPISKQPGASVSLQFEPPLPCTSQDCPNEATVGSAVYDPGLNGWTLFPLCNSCTLSLVRQYEDDARHDTEHHYLGGEGNE